MGSLEEFMGKQFSAQNEKHMIFFSYGIMIIPSCPQNKWLSQLLTETVRENSSTSMITDDSHPGRWTRQWTLCFQ